MVLHCLHEALNLCDHSSVGDCCHSSATGCVNSYNDFTCQCPDNYIYDETNGCLLHTTTTDQSPTTTYSTILVGQNTTTVGTIETTSTQRPTTEGITAVPTEEATQGPTTEGSTEEPTTTETDHDHPCYHQPCHKDAVCSITGWTTYTCR